jgi:hypothetical protein
LDGGGQASARIPFAVQRALAPFNSFSKANWFNARAAMRE